jgi:hypothetical protein
LTQQAFTINMEREMLVRAGTIPGQGRLRLQET